MPICESAMNKVAINFRDVFIRLELHGGPNPDPVRIRSSGLIFKEVANYEVIIGDRKFELFTGLIIGLEEKLGSDIATAAWRTAEQGITGKVIDTVVHALPPVEDRGKRQPQLGGRIPVDLRVQRDEILLSEWRRFAKVVPARKKGIESAEHPAAAAHGLRIISAKNIRLER